MSKNKAEFGVSASGVASKAELDQRIAARPKPRAELHLTPQGWEVADIRRKLDQASEQRIKHLQDRLKTAREGFRNDHRRSLVRGKAKSDFDRGR